MPFADWQAAHQTEAGAGQKAAFDTAFAKNVGTGGKPDAT
jgi:hypothetical protein